MFEVHVYANAYVTLAEIKNHEFGSQWVTALEDAEAMVLNKNFDLSELVKRLVHARINTLEGKVTRIGY